MKIKHLTAISPIDGRYEAQTKELRSFFSEFGLMKYRVQVEIEWFIHLSNQRTIPQLPRLSNNMKQNISNLYKKLPLHHIALNHPMRKLFPLKKHFLA